MTFLGFVCMIVVLCGALTEKSRGNKAYYASQLDKKKRGLEYDHALFKDE